MEEQVRLLAGEAIQYFIVGAVCMGLLYGVLNVAAWWFFFRYMTPEVVTEPDAVAKLETRIRELSEEREASLYVLGEMTYRISFLAAEGVPESVNEVLNGHIEHESEIWDAIDLEMSKSPDHWSQAPHIVALRERAEAADEENA